MADGPVFLERQTYRMRRMMDAIRLLPFLGLVLWMIPLVWPLAEATPDSAQVAIPMSVALKYLFGVWMMLVLVGWFLWRKTRNSQLAETDKAA